MTVASLNDFQMQINDDGQPNALVIGAGTDYVITEVDGFGVPAVRQGDLPRPEDRGSYFARDFVGQRMVTLKVVVTGDTISDALDNLDTLFGAWQLDTPDGTVQTLLAFKLPGRVARMFLGRPRDAVVGSTDIQGSQIPVTLLFATADPAIYDYLHTLVSGAGPTSPIVVSCTNAGNWNTRPRIIITGPVVNPALENGFTGEILSLTLSLATLATLVIDFEQKTISAGYSTKDPTSVWWELQPGTIAVALSGTGFTTHTLMKVEFNNAWLS